MKAKNIFLMSLGFMNVFFMTSCYYDNAAVLYPSGLNCNGANPSFSREVLPLAQSRCATTGCHSAGVSNSGGTFTNYSQISSKAAAIKTTILNGSMPKGSQFTDAEKKIFICWVNNGATNN